jgi:hypothetical protein
MNVDFTATAPTTPGVYNFQWQMYQSGGSASSGKCRRTSRFRLATRLRPPVRLSAFTSRHLEVSSCEIPTQSAPPILYSATDRAMLAGSLVGDWNGDGVDTVDCMFQRAACSYVRNSNTFGSAEVAFTYGPVGGSWIPVVGDWKRRWGRYNWALQSRKRSVLSPQLQQYWRRRISLSLMARRMRVGFLSWEIGTKNGVDTVGLYNPNNGVFYLRNSNTYWSGGYYFYLWPCRRGLGTYCRRLGRRWGRHCRLYNPAGATFFLRNSNSVGTADVTFGYGVPGISQSSASGNEVKRTTIYIVHC